MNKAEVIELIEGWQDAYCAEFTATKAEYEKSDAELAKVIEFINKNCEGE